MFQGTNRKPIILILYCSNHLETWFPSQKKKKNKTKNKKQKEKEKEKEEEARNMDYLLLILLPFNHFGNKNMLTNKVIKFCTDNDTHGRYVRKAGRIYDLKEILNKTLKG